jgi:hypothetical protein
MAIQSLSVVVPGKKCINNCKFCVSRTHEDITYPDRISEEFFTFHGKYVKALRYARDLGCTTLMLTGECEPQQNLPFLKRFFNNLLPENLFNNIEIQTTGRGLEKEDILSLAQLGINTFSISVSSFDDEENNRIIGNKDSLNQIKLVELCRNIKEAGCLLRLSLNLNDSFYHFLDTAGILRVCKQVYDADQVTLRKLYKSGKDCEQDKWIINHCNVYKDDDYFQYIRMNGTPLETLPYGMTKYSLEGVGTVADSDCMAKKNTDEIRYLILRPDCHLYTRWDDPASIIF